MKKILSLLMLPLLCVSCGNKQTRETLTQVNYSTYLNVVASVRNLIDEKEVVVNVSSTNPKYRFEGFCFLDICVTYYVYGHKSIDPTELKYAFLGVVLDEFGNGTGKPESASYSYKYKCSSITIANARPSGRDACSGTVVY